VLYLLPLVADSLAAGRGRSWCLRCKSITGFLGFLLPERPASHRPATGVGAAGRDWPVGAGGY